MEIVKTHSCSCNQGQGRQTRFKAQDCRTRRQATDGADDCENLWCKSADSGRKQTEGIRQTSDKQRRDGFEQICWMLEWHVTDKKIVRVDALSTPLAFFGRRLGFITDKRSMVVFLAVQPVHHFVTFGPAGHLDKSKALGLPGELIDNELSADHITKGATECGQLGFGYIIRQTTDEKFHAHPSTKGAASKNFSGIEGYEIDSVGYQKRKC
jgi:hypothetical protein